MRKGISQFDRNITTWLYHRPSQLRNIFDWITLLGHPVVVTFIAILICFAAFGFEQQEIATAYIVGLIALAIGSALKFALRRPRPDTPYALNMKQRTFSFPSGHSYGAGIVYGLMSFLALELFIAPWGALLTACLMLLIFLIGLSRIYLGAHYFLDVIAGWLLSIPVVLIVVEYIL